MTEPKSLSELQAMFQSIAEEEMSLQDYLDGCRNNPRIYASTAERMVAAIGEPTLIDTSKDKRLQRIFLNRTLKIYAPFADFYGMEDTIERIAGFFKRAAQGLEESKQIVYLLGPVGGGKSSLAVRIRELIEKEPIYVLKAGANMSPVFESPLGLFERARFGKMLEDKYGIPQRRLNTCMSPWAVKRLKEFRQGGKGIDGFTVVKIYPSHLSMICVSKTEPGDENNQDVSALTGKVNIRMLEKFNQNDVDAYSFSGGLNRTTQGILEFVEMFKAPLKMLHPLITATQDRDYAPSENIGKIPYQGVILAHSNETEWQSFRNNKNNEAMLDRICTIKVPYCLRATEERQIYEKLIRESELSSAPCAPGTLKMLAQFSVLSRIKEPENSHIMAKLKVYDGEETKESDTKAKPIQEYRDAAGVNEGMDGSSTRFAFKILSETYNFDPVEIAADPVHLMYVIEQSVRREQLPEATEQKLLKYLKDELVPRYAEDLGKDIQTCYIQAYNDFGQNMFDQYVAYADAWVERTEFKDPDTGVVMSREALEKELSKIEKPANIANPKDFRYEMVKMVLRARANAKTGGTKVLWTDNETMREVIEKNMFGKLEDLLPVISFGKKQDQETEKKHSEFLDRMVARGYTARQVRRLVEWYIRIKKS